MLKTNDLWQPGLPNIFVGIDPGLGGFLNGLALVEHRQHLDLGIAAVVHVRQEGMHISILVLQSSRVDLQQEILRIGAVDGLGISIALVAIFGQFNLRQVELLEDGVR